MKPSPLQKGSSFPGGVVTVFHVFVGGYNIASFSNQEETVQFVNQYKQNNTASEARLLVTKVETKTITTIMVNEIPQHTQAGGFPNQQAGGFANAQQQQQGGGFKW